MSGIPVYITELALRPYLPDGALSFNVIASPEYPVTTTITLVIWSSAAYSHAYSSPRGLAGLRDLDTSH